MSVTNVKDYLKTYGMDKRVLEFPVSSATVELAAKAVGVEPARIAKTLSFIHGDSERCILILTAGDARIDNAKFRQQFHFKARMLKADQVASMTGHQIGGVCPFGLLDQSIVDVYLDESLHRFDTVFPAAGSSNSALEVTCDELYQISCALAWVDVCKGWMDETV